jgi:acyl dehydratase
MKPYKFNLDDLHVDLSSTFRVTITEEHIKKFSELTGDYHPLHTNKSYAKEQGFMNVIAHGALITSMSSKLIGMDLPGLQSIVLSQKSEYIKPVFPGDELTFTGVVSKIRKPLSIVLVKINVFNQKNDEVSVIEYMVKIR